MFRIRRRFLRQTSCLCPQIIPTRSTMSTFFMHCVFGSMTKVFREGLHFMALRNRGTTMAFKRHVSKANGINKVHHYSRIIGRITYKRGTRSKIRRCKNVRGNFMGDLLIFTVAPTRVSRITPRLTFFSRLFRLLRVRKIIRGDVRLIPLICSAFPTYPPPSERNNNRRVIMESIFTSFFKIRSNGRTSTNIVFMLIRRFLTRARRES